jgi:hypothetical protein|tara:strand:- start:711 stop:881 length:171 start_codon:yes stop_codon:yes gene_type:complete
MKETMEKRASAEDKLAELRIEWERYVAFLKSKYPGKAREFKLECKFHKNIDEILNG